MKPTGSQENKDGHADYGHVRQDIVSRRCLGLVEQGILLGLVAPLPPCDAVLAFLRDADPGRFELVPGDYEILAGLPRFQGCPDSFLRLLAASSGEQLENTVLTVAELDGAADGYLKSEEASFLNLGEVNGFLKSKLPYQPLGQERLRPALASLGGRGLGDGLEFYLPRLAAELVEVSEVLRISTRLHVSRVRSGEEARLFVNRGFTTEYVVAIEPFQWGNVQASVFPVEGFRQAKPGCGLFLQIATMLRAAGFSGLSEEAVESLAAQCPQT